MTFDDLARSAMPYLPGAILAVVRKRVIVAATELCRQANVWVELTPVFIPAGMTLVEIDSDIEGASPLMVINLSVPGLRFTQPAINMLQLASSTNESRQIQALMSYMPLDSLSELPPQLEYWSKAIIDYAIFDLAQMPEKRWTNPNLAQFHYRMWLDQLNSAKQRSVQGYQAGSRRVKQRKFV